MLELVIFPWLHLFIKWDKPRYPWSSLFVLDNIYLFIRWDKPRYPLWCFSSSPHVKEMSFSCPIVHVWGQLIYVIPLIRKLVYPPKENLDTLHTLIMNGGIHRNGSYTCNSILISIKEILLSLIQLRTSSHHLDVILMSYLLHLHSLSLS